MAKILGILYVFIGLFVGFIFAFLSILGVAFGEQDFGPILGLIFGLGSIIFMPIFYGSLGFFFGLIGALIYNGVAKLVGGLEVEME
jgi:hypothetical protein